MHKISVRKKLRKDTEVQITVETDTSGDEALRLLAEARKQLDNPEPTEPTKE